MATSRLERIGTIFSRMEALLKQGAIKVDDRPLWYDIYKAFPPIVEPKFARPPPENKTIRPILYKEDVVRAKFHAKGHGISTNLLVPSGETQTKRLLQKYEALKSEGVAEDEIIEKSVTAVSKERPEFEKEENVRVNKESATAQVLEGADIKNIFNDK
ncbi:28S ribosomal protein S23, mitochondrial [Aricia agestis]|uniref:28S ribosomal protein S23, mitochondrial n=1 Tax=Aricia agestis TaxID=91739 RepID=UPI001C20AC47|nr:28S ribosomal protein S23, mitochondrial [Aricia agestis]